MNSQVHIAPGVTHIPGGINAARDAQQKLAALLAQYLAVFDLLGRLQVNDLVSQKAKKTVPLATTTRLVRFDAGDDGSGDVADGAALGALDFADVEPTGAIDYLRKLTPVTKEVFDGLTQQYRNIAFTIAGVADQRIVERVKDALIANLEAGGTERDFQKAVNAITTEEGVAQLAAFEIDVAFSTAMAQAYAAGRYEQMTQPEVLDALPYWQYLTVGDDRVRPEHAVLDYFIARADDPVWNKIYPPNGFNCRCIVVALLRSEAGAEADIPGMERLPLLARLKVPQPGFGKVF